MFEAFIVVLSSIFQGIVIGMITSTAISALLYAFIEMQPTVVWPGTLLWLIILTAVFGTYFAVKIPIQSMGN